MSKRSKKKRDRPPDDINELAAYIVNQVTSDHEDDCPGNNPDQGSDSASSHNSDKASESDRS